MPCDRDNLAPAQVDALVDHFARFSSDERQLPTVWHQALLVFVQRYKHEIRAEDKAALKRVTRMQHHHQVLTQSAQGPMATHTVVTRMQHSPQLMT